MIRPPSWQWILVLVLAISLHACAREPSVTQAPSRVILFSWDGAAHWATTEVMSGFDLPHLERLVQEGAWADGMVSSFPTKTAAAHAMLWTGRYGHENGITANSILLEPAAEHSRLESRTGYFAHGLKAEPLWTMTARAGLATYAFHATQSYPFEEATRWLEPADKQHLHFLYGYTRASSRPVVFDDRSNPTSPVDGWSIPEASTPGAREISLTLGDRSWWGLFFDDPEDPVGGLDTLGLTLSKDTASFTLRLKPGLEAARSEPVALSDEERLFATLRLFDLESQTAGYMLYLSSAKALITSSDRFPGATELAVEPFAGNGGGWAYEAGQLGVPIPQGGDGIAEDRFLKTLADLGDQLRAQARRVLDRQDYRLAILYSPILDDSTHAWAGYLDTSMPGHDPALAERLWPKLAGAYRIHEGLLADAMSAAERDGGNVILVSDHGMAGTNRLLHVNVALERAGLLTRNADGGIDLGTTRALMPPTADISIAVNTIDRAEGIVDPSERDAVLGQVREVLRGLRDPATGEPIVTGIFESATAGPLQPGGVTTGDLFLDLAPGYYPSDRLEADEIVSITSPDGNHIFLPTRRDMLAICGAWGRDIPGGRPWPRVRSIDIAPTVLDILGLPIPEDLPGDSLLAEPSAPKL